jgi:hypothetical protein
VIWDFRRLKKKALETILGDAIYGEIGVVSQSEIFRIIGLRGKAIIEANIYNLKEAWQEPLRF